MVGVGGTQLEIDVDRLAGGQVVDLELEPVVVQPVDRVAHDRVQGRVQLVRHAIAVVVIIEHVRRPVAVGVGARQPVGLVVAAFGAVQRAVLVRIRVIGVQVPLLAVVEEPDDLRSVGDAVAVAVGDAGVRAQFELLDAVSQAVVVAVAVEGVGVGKDLIHIGQAVAVAVGAVVVGRQLVVQQFQRGRRRSDIGGAGGACRTVAQRILVRVGRWGALLRLPLRLALARLLPLFIGCLLCLLVGDERLGAVGLQRRADHHDRDQCEGQRAIELARLSVLHQHGEE